MAVLKKDTMFFMDDCFLYSCVQFGEEWPKHFFAERCLAYSDNIYIRMHSNAKALGKINTAIGAIRRIQPCFERWGCGAQNDSGTGHV
ncbi:hypothetical protein DSECCO2_637550 [anaerobic digester metagenome]